MKKLNIPKISMRNLQRYKIRTSIMVIFTMIIVGMTFTSTILLKSMEKSIDNTIDRIGADIIVVPSEYEDDMKEALFLGEACSFYFDKAYVEDIKKIDTVVRQVFCPVQKNILRNLLTAGTDGDKVITGFEDTFLDLLLDRGRIKAVFTDVDAV